MLSTKHISGLFFIGILVISGFAPVLADTFNDSNTDVSPLVVQFGDSIEEQAAIAELKSNFPRAQVVGFSEYDRIVSFKGSVIYVGHSSNEGIQFNGKTVSWDVLAEIIRTSKSDSHYILGCESSKIAELTQGTGKRVFSFGQKVDAIFGAYFVSFLIFRSRQILSDMFLRIHALLYDISSALFLSVPEYSGTESGYQIGIKRESLQNKYCIWGKCAYTYLENIVWFNLAPWLLNLIKDISLFTSGIYFSYMVNALSAMSGISLFLSSTLVLAMIVALVLIIDWHAGQRKKGDLKLGMGIQVVPTPMFKAWIDNNEPEKEGDNGRYWYSTNPINTNMHLIYPLLFNIPTTWQKVY
ncbi:MAG: hypothetical protein D6732_09110 [Methanobacteriota archaeon]|nr:MAG: hypothetical protein D6732_09110 [Euryarchaeota archaeon]